MKFQVLNNEPINFYNANGDLVGTIEISGSGDMIIRPESGSTKDIIIGNSDTVGDVEIGIPSSPVNLTLKGGGTIGGNSNILNIGTTGDTVNIYNAVYSQSLEVTGSIYVTGSVYSDTFVGSGIGLTDIVSSSYAVTASYVNTLQQDVEITGSLEVTGSIGFTIASASAQQSFNVPGYYKTRWGQSDSDFVFYSDDYISLNWNEAATDQIEGQILTDPSSGEIQIIINNDGTYTYLDRQVSDGVFDIDSSFGNDQNLQFTIGSPMDINYPFYRVLVRSANSLGSGAGVTALVEKFI